MDRVTNRTYWEEEEEEEILETPDPLEESDPDSDSEGWL